MNAVPTVLTPVRDNDDGSDVPMTAVIPDSSEPEVASQRTFMELDDNDEEDDDDLGAPSEFICPLTLEVMIDPLMVRGGLSFERKAIIEWLNRGNTTCPLTRKPLSYGKLVPNAALRLQIQRWRIANGVMTVVTPRSDDGEGDNYSDSDDRDYHEYLFAGRSYLEIVGPPPIFQEAIAAHQQQQQHQTANRPSGQRRRRRSILGRRRSNNSDPSPRSRRRMLSLFGSIVRRDRGESQHQQQQQQS